ncbi:hypothetical protein ACJJIP_13795 [Microbulbifer sp. VTAC004]|uniref:hypothetical protein n=1 Tax=unclassified Microbulbifer TaxID=2619833 RepID=UPI00403A3411
MVKYFLVTVLFLMAAQSCAINSQVSFATNESDIDGCSYLGSVSTSGKTEVQAKKDALQQSKKIGGDILLDEPGVELAFSHGKTNDGQYFTYYGRVYTCKNRD